MDRLVFIVIVGLLSSGAAVMVLPRRTIALLELPELTPFTPGTPEGDQLPAVLKLPSPSTFQSMAVTLGMIS
jgi:hypothetical protein